MTDAPSHSVATRKTDAPAKGSPRSRKELWLVALLLIGGTAMLAWFRVGMLDLPAVPRGLTLETAGLADLQHMKQLNALIWSEPQSGSDSLNAADPSNAAGLVQTGVAAYRRGDATAALNDMRRGIRLDPNNLVLA